MSNTETLTSHTGFHLPSSPAHWLSRSYTALPLGAKSRVLGGLRIQISAAWAAVPMQARLNPEALL